MIFFLLILALEKWTTPTAYPRILANMACHGTEIRALIPATISNIPLWYASRIYETFSKVAKPNATATAYIIASIGSSKCLCLVIPRFIVRYLISSSTIGATITSQKNSIGMIDSIPTSINAAGITAIAHRMNIFMINFLGSGLNLSLRRKYRNRKSPGVIARMATVSRIGMFFF